MRINIAVWIVSIIAGFLGGCLAYCAISGWSKELPTPVKPESALHPQRAE